jgi:hypothetical protein
MFVLYSYVNPRVFLICCKNMSLPGYFRWNATNGGEFSPPSPSKKKSYRYEHSDITYHGDRCNAAASLMASGATVQGLSVAIMPVPGQLLSLALDA